MPYTEPRAGPECKQSATQQECCCPPKQHAAMAAPWCRLTCQARAGACAALELLPAQGSKGCRLLLLLETGAKARQTRCLGVERGTPRPPGPAVPQAATCTGSCRLPPLPNAPLGIQQADVASLSILICRPWGESTA